jgi:hypothetical protein
MQASREDIARVNLVVGRHDELRQFELRPRLASDGLLFPDDSSRSKFTEQFDLFRTRPLRVLSVDYMAIKHGMFEVFNSIVGGTSDLYSASTAQVEQAIARLVERAVASVRASGRGVTRCCWPSPSRRAPGAPAE